MKKFCGVLIFLMAALSLCAQINEFDWLVGTWQEKGKPNFEVWQRVGDELRAESFELSEDQIRKVNQIESQMKKIYNDTQRLYS